MSTPWITATRGTSHSFAKYMSGYSGIAWCYSVPGSTIQCN